MGRRWWVRSGLGLSIVLGMCLGVAASAAAQEGSWRAGTANVLSRSVMEYPARFNDVATCNGGTIGYALFKVEGFSYPACLFGEQGDVRVARFHHGARGWVYAIAFKGDTEFYHIKSVCSMMCAYAPDTDVFLQQAVGPVVQRRLGVYRHFTEALHREKDPVSGEIYYSFQPSSPPDMVMIGSQQAAVEASTVSENGEWIAVELPVYGILRVNVATMETRRVVAPGSDYGLGSDPSAELAISNDGNVLAVMGRHLGMTIYDLSDSCGEKVTGNPTREFKTGVVRCERTVVSTTTLFPGFLYGKYPSLSRDAKRLRATVVTNSGIYTQVVLSPALPDSQDPPTYFALGDSYTSGEGETENSSYLPYTDSFPHSCHVSQRSYPYLLAEQWNVPATSVACSGAVTHDIAGSGQYLGQGDRLAPLENEARQTLQAGAITALRQGIVRQLDFVEQYQPKIITLGIGGNDAGLMGKLSTCLGLATCEWAEPTTLRQAAGTEIIEVSEKIRTVIKEVRRASPGASIVVVGYPEIINASGECKGIVGYLLNPEERVFMREAIWLLNKTLAYAAKIEGVRFADVQDAFSGTALCDTAPLSMNGVRGGNDIAPISMLPLLKMIGAESFHPTPYGHTLVTQKIARQFSLPLLNQPCSCLIHPLMPPGLSSYWLSGGLPVSGLARLMQQKTIDAPLRPGGVVSAVAAKGTFEPNSQVRIELHSQTAELAVATAGPDGSLEQAVTIPSNTEEGYHTLHLLGTNRSQQPIDVYEVVAVDEVEQPSAPVVPGITLPLTPKAIDGKTATNTTTNAPPLPSEVVTSDSATVSIRTGADRGEVLGAAETRVASPTIAKEIDPVGVRQANLFGSWLIAGLLCALLSIWAVFLLKRKLKRKG